MPSIASCTVIPNAPPSSVAWADARTVITSKPKTSLSLRLRIRKRSRASCLRPWPMCGRESWTEDCQHADLHGRALLKHLKQRKCTNGWRGLRRTCKIRQTNRHHRTAPSPQGITAMGPKKSSAFYCFAPPKQREAVVVKEEEFDKNEAPRE